MFYERISTLCEERGEKVTPLIKRLGMSTSGVGRWQEGVLPNGETLSKFADYFGVSTDYLLGRTGGSFVMSNSNYKSLNNSFNNAQPNHKQVSLSKEEEKILEYFGDLEVEERMQALAYLKSLVDAVGEKDMTAFRRLALRMLDDLGIIYDKGIADIKLREELERLNKSGVVEKENVGDDVSYRLTPVGRLYAKRWAINCI